MNQLFARFYQLLHYTSPYSDDMFAAELYSPLGLMMLFSSLFLVGVYYYAINHPRFNRWYHWSLFLLLSSVVNFLYAYFTVRTEFVARGFQYDTEYFITALTAALLGFVAFAIFSFCFRWWSRNCSHTPLPL